jgi:hypothetical protein
MSLEQMAELFQRDKSTILRHIKNIYAEGELIRELTVANFATVQKGRKIKIGFWLILNRIRVINLNQAL